MKKTLTAAYTSAVLVFMNAMQVHAGGTDVKIDPPGGLSGDIGPDQIISFVINAFFALGILAALIYLLWGGLNWILSGGDKDKVDAARQRMVAAIIGLVLIVLSYFILDFVVRLLGFGCGLNTLSLPSLNPERGSGLKC